MVGLHHRFDGISNNLPTGKRIAHAIVTHDNPIIYANGVELKRDPASRPNGFLDDASKLLQMNMAGDDVDIRIGNTNEGLVHVGIG